LLELRDVINENMILLDLKIEKKEEVIEILVDLLGQNEKLTSKALFLKSVYDREELLSTYCGSDIAIPHGISKAVKEPAVCFARTNEISWSGPEEKVHFVFLLAVPDSKNDKDPQHLKLLSSIATLILEEQVREIWERATNKKQILESLELAVKNL